MSSPPPIGFLLSNPEMMENNFLALASFCFLCNFYWLFWYPVWFLLFLVLWRCLFIFIDNVFIWFCSLSGSLLVEFKISEQFLMFSLKIVISLRSYHGNWLIFLCCGSLSSSWSIPSDHDLSTWAVHDLCCRTELFQFLVPIILSVWFLCTLSNGIHVRRCCFGCLKIIWLFENSFKQLRKERLAIWTLEIYLK